MQFPAGHVIKPGMKLRLLLPCAGLLGGALTARMLREAPSARAAALAKSAPATATLPVPAISEIPRQSTIATLPELFALWGPDGAVGIFEMLDGVPAQTLAAWLDELMPPESYSRSLVGEQRDGIRQALVERLAARDPAMLVAWLLKVPNGYLGTQWTEAAAHALLHRGTPEAQTLLAALEKKDAYVWQLRLRWLAERDPAAALHMALEKPGSLLPPVLASWLAADRVQALAFANEHPRRAFAVLGAIATEGRAALAQFAAGLTDVEAQHHARRLQLTAAAREGDAAACSALLRRDGRSQNDSLQDSAIATMMKHHPEAGEALIRQFSDQPALRQVALNRLAQEHPARAAALAVEDSLRSAIFSATGDGRQFLSTLSRAWSLADPSAAQAWLRGLPEEQRALAVPSASHITDDLSTEEWMALNRGLPVSSQGMSTLTRELLARTTDPAVQAQWGLTFSEEARTVMLYTLRSEMENPAAADALAAQWQALAPPTP